MKGWKVSILGRLKHRNSAEGGIFAMAGPLGSMASFTQWSRMGWRMADTVLRRPIRVVQAELFLWEMMICMPYPVLKIGYDYGRIKPLSQVSRAVTFWNIKACACCLLVTLTWLLIDIHLSQLDVHNIVGTTINMLAFVLSRSAVKQTNTSRLWCAILYKG